jgi:hypothetical protein
MTYLATFIQCEDGNNGLPIVDLDMLNESGDEKMNVVDVKRLCEVCHISSLCFMIAAILGLRISQTGA